MTNWVDVVSSVLGLAVFIGVVAGAIYAAQAISNTIDETKKSLNQKGVNVSTSGISVKTGKHMTREAYLDATQRGVVKAIQTSTTTIPDSGLAAQPNGSQRQHRSPSITRSSTSGSNRSVGSTKKKSGLFGIRKSASKHSNGGT